MSRLAASLFVAAVVAAACSTVEDPQGLPGSGGDDVGFGGSTPAAPCEPEGAQRECKIDIDAHNCFVGVQICEDGDWGDCREGDVQQKALGPQAPCTTNPCNATCEQFDENPMAPLETQSSGSLPTSSGGAIEGMPPGWQDALLKDQAHVGMNCSTSGACNGDYYCDGTGTTCVPWQPGEYDNTTTDPNFTAPISCGTTVVVCNRGGGTAPAGVEVSIYDAELDPGSIGQCSGITEAPRGTCLTPSTIAPGDCIAVPGCSPFVGFGHSLIYVNGESPPAPVPETDCADSWSMNYFGTCQCMNETVSASLTDVSMYLFLDNSGSMNTGGATDLWDNAKAAVTSFVQDPGSASYNVAWRMFGNGCCNNNCSGAPTACATPQYGPDFLSNVTHQNNIIGSMPANAPGGCGTPLGPVVRGIVNWTTNRKTSFPAESVGGILITDGDFSGCTPNTVATTAALTTAGYNNGAGPPFYVVALNGADINFCQQVSEPDSNCIDLTASTDPGADLIAALEAISGSLVGCNFNLPNLGELDLSTLEVEYFPNGTTPSTTFNNVNDITSCMPPNDDEYYFDDPSNPTALLMCADGCDTIKADPNAIVKVTGDCLQPGNTTGVYNFEYQADCSSYGSGVGPTWDFLAYDTTVPATASAVFEARTAPSQAELAMATWVTVATATSTNPDVTMANPVLLSDYLSGPQLRNEWLELQITVNPTIDQSDGAVVNNWDLSFSCLDNE